MFIPMSQAERTISVLDGVPLGLLLVLCITYIGASMVATSWFGQTAGFIFLALDGPNSFLGCPQLLPIVLSLFFYFRAGITNIYTNSNTTTTTTNTDTQRPSDNDALCAICSTVLFLFLLFTYPIASTIVFLATIGYIAFAL